MTGRITDLNIFERSIFVDMGTPGETEVKLFTRAECVYCVTGIVAATFADLRIGDTILADGNPAHYVHAER